MPSLNVIQPGVGGKPIGVSRRVGSIAVRIYRVAVVVTIVVLLRRHESRLRIDGDRPIRIEEARAFFPAADRLSVDSSERMGLWVLDHHGEKIGYVLRTSPMSDKIVGYSGPTDTLVALTPDKQEPKVVGIKVRYSSDTKQHVADVVADDGFMGTWNGKTWDEIAGTDPRAAGIEGVSGASLTSMCIANGIRHRFEQSNQATKASEKAAHEPIHLRGSDFGLAAVIVVAMVFSFTHLRSKTWLRRSFQVVLIGYVGFINGQILAQSLLAGWASTAVPWRAAPGLALLAATALIVPLATRRQVYCSHICPHGAAQELIGRVTHRWMKRPPKLPRSLDHGLHWLPPMLIALVLFVTMLHVPFDLAGIEPFDGYLIRNAGAATIAVAVAGLVAAAIVPMAYCRFGCPTGMVLSFVRSHGKADGFSRRDLAAGVMVLGVIALYYWYQPLHMRLIG
jgi:hypothetical protein